MWRYVWNLRWVCVPASKSLATAPTLFLFFFLFFLHSCHLTLLTSLNVTAAHVNQTSCRSSSEPACWLLLLLFLDCSPCSRASFFLLVAHPVACGWKCSLINFRTHPIQSCGCKLFYLLSAWTLIKDFSWFANCFVVYWWLSAIFRQKKKADVSVTDLWTLSQSINLRASWTWGFFMSV